MGEGRGIKMAVLLALLPAGVIAQAARPCTDGVEPVGSLGITGIACDRCRFFTNGQVHRAVFWTEPTILDVDASNPASSVLRKGDVLVAVDGQLITTREGSARFSALPPDRDADLRIRRDGKLMEVRAPVSPVCPSSKEALAPVVAGRPVPEPPVPATAPTPPAAPAPVTPSRPTPPAPATPALPAVPPAAPAPPAPPAMRPRASLGFAFQCSFCGYHGEKDGAGRWSFRDAPVVTGLDEETPGAASGLRVGDRLMALDGLALTSEQGGRRFAAIRPGERLDWTVEREGRRLHVTMTARPPSSADAAAPALAAGPAGRAPLRFTGAVGNTTVEVRGGRVTVTEDEGGRLVIIRTGDAEIRIRAPEGGGR